MTPEAMAEEMQREVREIAWEHMRLAASFYDLDLSKYPEDALNMAVDAGQAATVQMLQRHGLLSANS
jgi:histidinol-phosphate/aromatic aminotransferase/cobyric acid decarboxylase-like protein